MNTSFSPPQARGGSMFSDGSSFGQMPLSPSGNRSRRYSQASVSPVSPSQRTRGHSRAGNSPYGQRRSAHAKPGESESVKVMVRVRPFVPREIQLHELAAEKARLADDHAGTFLRSMVEMPPDVPGSVVVLDAEQGWSERERFEFDQAMWSIPAEQQEYEGKVWSQEDVFQGVGMPAHDNLWKGYNGCIFAYGQTGSGKTHTMMGGEDGEHPGVIPRLCRTLFESMEKKRAECAGAAPGHFEYSFKVEVRFMEIYNERVKDLLWALKTPEELLQAQDENHGQMPDPTNLKVRQHPVTGPYVVSMTARECSSWDGAGGVAEMLERGNRERAVASTAMNNRSSRSHAVFRINFAQTVKSRPRSKFEKPTVNTTSACLNLVDLAGSERVKKSKAEGQTLTEAANINLSLSTLKMVIDALVENSKGRRKAIPFRDATLTWLLSDSLGGNSKTVMIANVSPHPDNTEETVNTLRYASRAREIVNTVYVNEDSDARRVQELEMEMLAMQQQLAESDPTSGQHQALRGKVEATEGLLREKHSEVDRLGQETERLQEAAAREREAHRCASLRYAFQVSLERRLKERFREQVGRLEADLRRLQEQSRQHRGEADGARSALELHQAQHRELQEGISRHQRELDKTRAAASHAEQKATELGQQLAAERAERERAEREAAREARRRAEAAAEERAALAAKHDAALEAVIREASVAHDRYVGQWDAERRALQADLRRAQEDLAAGRSQWDQRERELQQQHAARASQLRSLRDEVGELEREREQLRERLGQEISKAGDEWRARFHRREAELLENLDAANGRWEAKCRELEQRLADAQQQGAERARAVRQEEEVKQEERLRRQRDEQERSWGERERELLERLEAKAALNQEMHSFLRDVEARERKYGALAHRISAALEQAPQFGSPDYMQLLANLRSFHAEYTSFAPSKYRLQHLLRIGDSAVRHRCTAAPVVGEDFPQGACGFFPLQPAPARECSRPPSRGRRRPGARSPSSGSRSGTPTAARSRGRQPAAPPAAPPSAAPPGGGRAPPAAAAVRPEERFAHNPFRHA